MDDLTDCGHGIFAELESFSPNGGNFVLWVPPECDQKQIRSAKRELRWQRDVNNTQIIKEARHADDNHQH